MSHHSSHNHTERSINSKRQYKHQHSRNRVCKIRSPRIYEEHTSVLRFFENPSNFEGALFQLQTFFNIIIIVKIPNRLLACTFVEELVVVLVADVGRGLVLPVVMASSLWLVILLVFGAMLLTVSVWFCRSSVSSLDSRVIETGVGLSLICVLHRLVEHAL